MKVLSVYNIFLGSAFIIGDNIPTSLMVWLAISKIIRENFPNLQARVMPGSHANTDYYIIEVITENNALVYSQVHKLIKLIENISIDRLYGCKVFYKGQIINPD